MSTKQTISLLDSATIRQLRDEMNAALSPLADKYGITIRATSAKMGLNFAEFKVELTQEADPNTKTPEALLFEQFAQAIGFQKSDLGREFNLGRQTFKIAGYNPKATKNNMLVVETTPRSKGGTYVMAARTILMAMELPPIPASPFPNLPDPPRRGGNAESRAMAAEMAAEQRMARQA